MTSPHPEFFLRLYFSPTERLGPGKAALLERIGATGSISAAARDLGMSYKRAWTLVEEMNAMFAAPLVASARGGPGGGGAILTEAGARVLALFREIEAESARANADRLAALQALRPDMSGRK